MSQHNHTGRHYYNQLSIADLCFAYMYDMQICLFSQPDLAVHKCADTQQYVGLTDLDPTLNNINNNQSELASHALQFIFNGYNGYSFPAAHYPVKGVSSEELNHLTQTLILALEEHGFTVNTQKVLNNAHHKLWNR